MAQHGDDEEATGLDPIALTLAVWLGLLAGGTGLMRLSDDAVARTAIAQGAAQAARVTDRPGDAAAQSTTVFNPGLMAFGG